MKSTWWIIWLGCCDFYCMLWQWDVSLKHAILWWYLDTKMISGWLTEPYPGEFISQKVDKQFLVDTTVTTQHHGLDTMTTSTDVAEDLIPMWEVSQVLMFCPCDHSFISDGRWEKTMVITWIMMHRKVSQIHMRMFLIPICPLWTSVTLQWPTLPWMTLHWPPVVSLMTCYFRVSNWALALAIHLQLQILIQLSDIRFSSIHPSTSLHAPTYHWYPWNKTIELACVVKYNYIGAEAIHIQMFLKLFEFEALL